MPTVRMTIPKSDLTEEHKVELIKRLTDTVGTFYKEKKREDVKNYVMVHINETAEKGYALGGEIIA